jgi:hypothetical protein
LEELSYLKSALDFYAGKLILDDYLDLDFCFPSIEFFLFGVKDKSYAEFFDIVGKISLLLP